jgi:hypothetical protein
VDPPVATAAVAPVAVPAVVRVDPVVVPVDAAVPEWAAVVPTSVAPADVVGTWRSSSRPH